MDLGKENGSLLLHRGMSSDITSRVQGVKGFHQSLRKDVGVTKRRPLGLVNSQSVNEFSKNNAKGKQKPKVDFKKSTEYEKPSLLPIPVSAIDTQPCSNLHNPILQSTDVAEIQYDEIEFMDRPKDLEGDFCDLCPVADQPATYVGDLLSWYPCMWSGGKRSSSPVSERSLSPITSPDWQSKGFWLDEVVVEPQLPDLPSFHDDLDDEL